MSVRKNYVVDLFMGVGVLITAITELVASFSSKWDSNEGYPEFMGLTRGLWLAAYESSWFSFIWF